MPRRHESRWRLLETEFDFIRRTELRRGRIRFTVACSSSSCSGSFRLGDAMEMEWPSQDGEKGGLGDGWKDKESPWTG